MSAVIKTTTPFILEEILIKALIEEGAAPIQVTVANVNLFKHRERIQIGDIVTNRSDYYGPQYFRFEQGTWILRHDSSEMNGRVNLRSVASTQYQPVNNFLSSLSNKYELAYQQYLERLAEQERARLEEERKARIEATRQQTIEKAKAQGYSVKETRNSKNQIQLVLTRMV